MAIRAICPSSIGWFVCVSLSCRRWQTVGLTDAACCQTGLGLTLASAVVLLILGLTGTLEGQTLHVSVADSTRIVSATAEAEGTGVQTKGVVRDGLVVFEKLLPETPYQLRLELRDGTVMQGVDLGWYAPLTDTTPSGELDASGREEIAAIITKVPQFYSRSEMLRLNGNARRATALVQLIRDTAFHGDKAGEIIWRVELWYFEYQAGGWARVSQQNVVLRRERFRDRAAFERATSKLRWMPELGGLRLREGETRKIDWPGE